MPAITRRALAFSTLAAVAAAPVSAAEAPTPIDDGLFVDINGMPQWITLRGQDAANPVLLWLHGGPGFPMSGMARVFADWERDFTVVQWDQPGGGATYAKNAPQEGPLTMERYVKDALAVAEYVRGRLGKRKIALIGVSWGTALGAVMIKRRPELFSVYVGVSQVVSGPRGGLMGYQMGLAAAKARGDAKAVEALTRVGPPPYARFEDFLTRQQFTNAPAVPPSAAEMAAASAFLPLAFAPPPADARYVARGLPPYNGEKTFLDTQRALFGETWKWDIEVLGRDFKVPIVLIEGEVDLNTPTPLAREWLDGIRAPKKVFEVIPGAGHGPLAFHADILKLLQRDALPLARRG